ncbi:DEK domain-containing chromatin-associated protein 4-like [Phaseolus vulgaris]|uniref:DEK domain-containing chromatin-associated protein 4-like n=1 Tax=Phaseolus vulgaris TaxID=3885 RepID=UPI0035CBBBBD
MQNSESVKMEATTTMTTAATPIQATEGSHGDGEKGIVCSLQTMELKGGADDVTEADSLDPEPFAVVGHKRKASSEIDPHCVNSPDSVSSPTVAHHAEMVPQGGENEKVEGDNNMPQRGILLDLNQGPEEIDSYLYDDVFKEKVETVAKVNIEVKPEGKKGIMLHGAHSDFDLNQEGVVDTNSDQEKDKVESGDSDTENPEEDEGIPHGGLSKMDTSQGEGTVNSSTEVEKETQLEIDSVESKEVVPYVAENEEVVPSAIEKIEGEHSAVVENTEEALSENKQVEPPSSMDEIEVELNCELNKECDSFSDTEVESKSSAVPAETHAADKNNEVEVEGDAAEEMEVEPYDVAPEKKNEEVEADAAEKVEVVPHSVDPEKKKNKEMEVDAAEKVGAQACTEKHEHEAGSSTTGEKEVETSSPVKVGLLRGPLDFDLDLNELPSMEED